MTVGSGGTSIGKTEASTFVTTNINYTMPNKKTLSTATLNGTATTISETINLSSAEFIATIVREYKKGIPSRQGRIPIYKDSVDSCRRYIVDNDTICTNLMGLTPGDKYYIPVYLEGDTVNYATLQNSLSGYHTVDDTGKIVITIPAGTEVYLFQETANSITLKTHYYFIPV